MSDVQSPSINPYSDAMVVRSYIGRLLAAGINVPPGVSDAAERLLNYVGKEHP